jgi:hypothetical protein
MSIFPRCAGFAAVACPMMLTIPELLGIPGSGIAVAQTVENDWRFSITPYLWGNDIRADVRFPAGQAVSGQLRFDDLLDKLDLAAQVHVEAQRDEWGMFADVTYLSLSDGTTHGPISADADVETGIYEFAAIYTPGGEDGQFTALAGARMLNLDLDVTFSAPGAGASIRRTQGKSFTAFMFGGRFTYPFNDRWLLNLRGDIGVGETESAWNALAGMGWRFGGDLDNTVLFGWRHMEIEVEDGGRKTDVTFDGPIAGVRFGF